MIKVEKMVIRRVCDKWNITQIGTKKKKRNPAFTSSVPFPSIFDFELSYFLAFEYLALSALITSEVIS